MSENKAFCASDNRAFIASTNRARGCADYQVVLGTAAQKFGFINVNSETKLRRWKSVWLFNQNLELQASTVSGAGGPATGNSTAFRVAAVQGGDFFVNNGRRMTFTVPPVVVWNGLGNDSSLGGLALSAKRRRVFTSLLGSYSAYDMDSGVVLNNTSTSQIMGSQDAVTGPPVSAPAEPWGCYVRGEEFSGFTTIANDMISLSEDLSVRWRADLGVGFQWKSDYAADQHGVIAGGLDRSNPFAIPPIVKRFDTQGNLMWTWTDPAYNGLTGMSSNGIHVVFSSSLLSDLDARLVLLNAVTGEFVSSALAVGPSSTQGLAFQGLAIGPDGCVFVAGRSQAPDIPLAFRAIWKYDAQLNFVKYAVNLEGGTSPHDVRIVQKL